MSEVESHCENSEKHDNEQTVDELPVVEQDSSLGSKIKHLGTIYLLVCDFNR